jgi:Putative Actinobacterial Holin-X, holin superfamily III
MQTMQSRHLIDGQEGTSESLGELLSQLTNHSAALVRDEMALAKQELVETARSLSRGITRIVLGTLIGLIALAGFAAAAAIRLADFMAPAYAALVVAGALALLGGAIAAAGIGRLKRTTLTPEQTMETLEENKEWLKDLT